MFRSGVTNHPVCFLLRAPLYPQSVLSVKSERRYFLFGLFFSGPKQAKINAVQIRKMNSYKINASCLTPSSCGKALGRRKRQCRAEGQSLRGARRETGVLRCQRSHVPDLSPPEAQRMIVRSGPYGGRGWTKQEALGGKTRQARSAHKRQQSIYFVARGEALLPGRTEPGSGHIFVQFTRTH